MLVQAQSVSIIGMTKEEAKEIVNKKYRNFRLDNTIVKQEFNYLKYVNGIQTITWILFFSKEDICTSSKKVCDYSEYDFIIKKLNKEYQMISDMHWESDSGNHTTVMTLEEKDWYFVVHEKMKEK